MRLLLALLLLPTASALDALPEAARLGLAEATVVVRAQGAIRVAADAPVEAAVADGTFHATPASLDVPPAAAWHGLPGAVEVRLRRTDPTRDVRVELDDGETGVVVEWPGHRDAPAPAALLPLAAAAFVGARRRRSGRGAARTCAGDASPP